MKHSKSEKKAHLIEILSWSNESSQKIQNRLKGTEWSMRRQDIQRISKEKRESAPIEAIKNDKYMFPSTKQRLITEIKRNHKRGEQYKTRDMMHTIYQPQSPRNEQYKNLFER